MPFDTFPVEFPWKPSLALKTTSFRSLLEILLFFLRNFHSAPTETFQKLSATMVWINLVYFAFMFSFITHDTNLYTQIFHIYTKQLQINIHNYIGTLVTILWHKKILYSNIQFLWKNFTPSTNVGIKKIVLQWHVKFKLFENLNICIKYTLSTKITYIQ